MAVNEAEETFKRLSALPGVQGLIVINGEGIPVRTTFPQSKTALYVSLIHGLIVKTKSTVKEIDISNELTFMRLRSHKDEILIAPDREYTMIVVQKPTIK